MSLMDIEGLTASAAAVIILILREKGTSANWYPFLKAFTFTLG